MKTLRKKVRACGFTLIELMVAMTIASSVILLVLYLNDSGAKWWKSTKDSVYTSNVSRVAMQTIAQDLESFQMKPGNNNYEWLYAGKDKDDAKKAASKQNKGKSQKKNKPSGLGHIPDSARLIFFSCSPVRNPAVSHDVNDRDVYRSELVSAGTGMQGDNSYKGDVCAICYCLEYKDNISNSDPGKGEGVFPVFSLYRRVMSAEKTYEEVLCAGELDKVFDNNLNPELICDNVVEMNLSFNIEYTPKGTEKQKNSRRLQTVTVISSNGRSNEVCVRGNSVFVDGNELRNARIVSANINVSVLTEDGVVMVDRLRQGDAKLNKQLRTEAGLVDFFRDYTRQFSRAVSMPQPY